MYGQAKRGLDIADAELAAARNKLLVLTNHPGEQESGVAVPRFWKTGKINYKKVPVLHELN